MPETFRLTPELYGAIWIIFDADAAKENLKGQTYYIMGWRHVGHAFIILVRCVAHQVHLAVKPLVRLSRALTPMFACVKILRQLQYRLQVKKTLKQLCKDRMRIVMDVEPRPEHRDRALLLMNVTYLREAVLLEGACPSREGAVRGAERRMRRWGRVLQLLEVINFAWTPWSRPAGCAAFG